MNRKTIKNICKKNWLNFELFGEQHNRVWKSYELKIMDDRAIDWRVWVNIDFNETLENLQWKIDQIKLGNFAIYY